MDSITTYKYILLSLIFILLVTPINAILTCQCDGARHPYCISFGNTIDCAPEDRIPIIEPTLPIETHISDGSREYPKQWDDNTPMVNGWYYYTSPSRPFYKQT